MAKRPASLGANKLISDMGQTHAFNLAAMRECVIKGAGSPTAAVRPRESFARQQHHGNEGLALPSHLFVLCFLIPTGTKTAATCCGFFIFYFNSNTTGQWSLPITFGKIAADFRRGTNFLDTNQ
jgi:hypothetical protein